MVSPLVYTDYLRHRKTITRRNRFKPAREKNTTQQWGKSILFTEHSNLYRLKQNRCIPKQTLINRAAVTQYRLYRDSYPRRKESEFVETRWSERTLHDAKAWVPVLNLAGFPESRFPKWRTLSKRTEPWEIILQQFADLGYPKNCLVYIVSQLAALLLPLIPVLVIVEDRSRRSRWKTNGYVNMVESILSVSS